MLLLVAGRSPLSPPRSPSGSSHLCPYRGSSRSPLRDSRYGRGDRAQLRGVRAAESDLLRYQIIPCLSREHPWYPRGTRSPSSILCQLAGLSVLAAQHVTAGSSPLLPRATRMEGPVCPALGPAFSSASSCCRSRAGPFVSSPSCPPARREEHPSLRGYRVFLSDKQGTGRR